MTTTTGAIERAAHSRFREKAPADLPRREVAIEWRPMRCILADGLTAEGPDGRRWELIPYAAPDGSGAIGGLAIAIDHKFLARIDGTPDAARAVAEVLIAAGAR